MAGLFQLVTRRSIWKVDVPILVLGAFYGILAACYVFFEVVVINYRPVILTQGPVLEASFPSSHTMASICIMATAMIEFHDYLRKRRGWLMAADTAAVLIQMCIRDRVKRVRQVMPEIDVAVPETSALDLALMLAGKII